MIRPTYDLLDMIRTARRFKTENNFMVLPDDIASQLEDELTRLYTMEDEAIQQAAVVANGNEPHWDMETFLKRMGVMS